MPLPPFARLEILSFSFCLFSALLYHTDDRAVLVFNRIVCRCTCTVLWAGAEMRVVAQLVEYQVRQLLTQVPLPSGAEDVSLRVSFQCRV